MAKALYTLPNLLSAYRIAVVPLIALCFYIGGETALWVATALFFIGCWSDYFDGALARRWQQTSMIGKFLDASADKVMVGGLLLLLVGFDRLTGPWILVALVIFVREIMIAGLREFLGQQKVDVPVSWMGKWKTAVQMLASGFLIPGVYAETVMPYASLIGKTLFLAAMVMTVVSAWDYLRKGYETMLALDQN